MNDLWIILYQLSNSAHKILLHKQFFIVKLKSPLVHPGTQNITEYFNFQIMKYTSDLVLNVEPNCSVINVYKLGVDRLSAWPIIGADIKHFTDYRYRPF